jgi:nucleotide-binding universal stress UspA family protein
VAVDLGPSTPAVLRTAFALAGRLALDLDILHVQSDLEPRPLEAAVEAQEALRPLVPPALAAGTRLHVRPGEPTDAIVGFLGEVRPAFLVIGSHAHGFFARWFARDTARTVMHEASCPVWVVRSEGRPGGGPP